MFSLLIQQERIYFFDFKQPKDLLLPKQLKPKEGIIATNTQVINLCL
jgi:hypothetical protein